MEKSVILSIMVDRVKLSDLENIVEAIEELLKDYEDKRITTTLQDDPVVRFR